MNNVKVTQLVDQIKAIGGQVIPLFSSLVCGEFLSRRRCWYNSLPTLMKGATLG